MKIPKLHSDELNAIVTEISSIDDNTVKIFKKLNNAVNERANKAYKKIDGIIADIKKILKTNECGKMDIVLGNRRFILHNSVKDVYISIVGAFDEVISSWPPKSDPKLDEAKKLKTILCKNDALENVGKVQYIEEHARYGEDLLKEFISSYREHISTQLRNLETFIKDAYIEPERKPKNELT